MKTRWCVVSAVALLASGCGNNQPTPTATRGSGTHDSTVSATSTEDGILQPDDLPGHQSSTDSIRSAPESTVSDTTMIVDSTPTPPATEENQVVPPPHPPADDTDNSDALGADLAFNSNADGDEEIYVMDLDSGDLWQLTDNAAADIAPAWSTDGYIAYASNRDGNWELYAMKADGTGQTRITYTPNADESRPSWSNDNRRLAFDAVVLGNQDVYVYSFATNLITRCTTHNAIDAEPHFDVRSPSEIMFSTFRNGNWDLYTTTCTMANEERQWSSEAYLEGYGSLDYSGEWLLYHARREGPMNVYLTSSYPSATYMVGDPAVQKMMPARSRDFTQVVWQTTGRSDGTYICLTSLSSDSTVWLVRAGTSQFAYPRLR